MPFPGLSFRGRRVSKKPIGPKEWRPFQFLSAAETYEYDLLGRRAKVIYDDSTRIAYTYDNNGNILTIEVAGDVGTSVKGPRNDLLPKVFALGQNYPNPFNPSTQINDQLPVAAQVKLIIYNMPGRRARTLIDEEKPAGFYTVQWHGVNDRGEQAANLYEILPNVWLFERNFSTHS